ncbi:phosphoacetylglucosamine mutase [Clavulina sp. PMI_390]|nr:phosphoacetylglucosamine mutase [Clavulina sp. PMI_390]
MPELTPPPLPPKLEFDWFSPEFHNFAGKYRHTHDFSYGTAGFRNKAAILETVMFRCGIVAALRSKRLEGKTIGVMITASHNPEEDNGVKIVDPKGEMLQFEWEAYATAITNARTTDDLMKEIKKITDALHIDMSAPARVVYGRDTRPSSESLSNCLEEGLLAMGAEGRNVAVVTTPILHYFVRCINTKGTMEEYGIDTEEGYYKKMATAFKKLMKNKTAPPRLIVDCANGVGSLALGRLEEELREFMEFQPVNVAVGKKGALNKDCGADFVKTQQRLPSGVDEHLQPGQRGCSLDGDADRLIYYYIDDDRKFRMLDGDKISVLLAQFIHDLLTKSGIDMTEFHVGVVQTAYANGHSTAYLEGRIPHTCVSTGVKHLHQEAERYFIGVYFEANGHGTVLFPQSSVDHIKDYEPKNPTERLNIEYLLSLGELANQAVGDALSDMLLVEAVLAHRKYGAWEWDSMYKDLPNRLMKVAVRNRADFTTEDAERKLVTPAGLQQRINDTVLKFPEGRAFVRPSGTEDVVRVYAEALTQSMADDLALKVALIVHDEAGFGEIFVP